MDYSKFKVPYIGNLEIKERAEKFREKYWNKILPIDIEKIIDVSLEINIIPIPELEKLCNTDALITSDWECLYIDKNLFDDERRQNRLRFSLAHEIGHYILHRNLYTILKITSVEDFYNFILKVSNDQYSYLETQANKFAGHLLVPRELLSKHLNDEFKKARAAINIDKFDKILLKSYIANPLAKRFGMSQESMEIILGEFNIFKNKIDS